MLIPPGNSGLLSNAFIELISFSDVFVVFLELISEVVVVLVPTDSPSVFIVVVVEFSLFEAILLSESIALTMIGLTNCSFLVKSGSDFFFIEIICSTGFLGFMVSISLMTIGIFIISGRSILIFSGVVSH